MENIEETKVCKKCNKKLPISAFNKVNKNTKTRNSNCNECIAKNPVYNKIRRDTKKRQNLFLAALTKNASNISAAVRATGVSRQTHLNWVENFESYKRKVEEIQESTIDWVEGKMMSLIKKEDKTMVIFYLKTKAKHRGYIERQEIDQESSAEVTVTHKGQLSDAEMDARIKELEMKLGE